MIAHQLLPGNFTPVLFSLFWLFHPVLDHEKGRNKGVCQCRNRTCLYCVPLCVGVCLKGVCYPRQECVWSFWQHAAFLFRHLCGNGTLPAHPIQTRHVDDEASSTQALDDLFLHCKWCSSPKWTYTGNIILRDMWSAITKRNQLPTDWLLKLSHKPSHWSWMFQVQLLGVCGLAAYLFIAINEHQSKYPAQRISAVYVFRLSKMDVVQVVDGTANLGSIPRFQSSHRMVQRPTTWQVCGASWCSNGASRCFSSDETISSDTENKLAMRQQTANILPSEVWLLWKHFDLKGRFVSFHQRTSCVWTFLCTCSMFVPQFDGCVGFACLFVLVVFAFSVQAFSFMHVQCDFCAWEDRLCTHAKTQVPKVHLTKLIPHKQNLSIWVNVAKVFELIWKVHCAKSLWDVIPVHRCLSSFGEMPNHTLDERIWIVFAWSWLQSMVFVFIFTILINLWTWHKVNPAEIKLFQKEKVIFFITSCLKKDLRTTILSSKKSFRHIYVRFRSRQLLILWPLSRMGTCNGTRTRTRSPRSSNALNYRRFHNTDLCAKYLCGN